MSRIRHLIALAACMLAGTAFANSDNGKQTLTTVGLHDSGNAMVAFVAMATTEHCASPGWENTLVISKTNPNFKAMYATALTALATGRQVQAYTNGCTDIWGNGSTMVTTMTTIFLTP